MSVLETLQVNASEGRKFAPAPEFAANAVVDAEVYEEAAADHTGLPSRSVRLN